MEKVKFSSQERICEIIQLLYKNQVMGLTNKELAQALHTTEANICRDMAVFEKYDFVVRSGKSKWRLSPTFGGIAGHIMRSFQQAKLALTEEEAKYASAMQ